MHRLGASRKKIVLSAGWLVDAARRFTAQLDAPFTSLFVVHVPAWNTGVSSSGSL